MEGENNSMPVIGRPITWFSIVLVLAFGSLSACAFMRGNYGESFNPADVAAIQKGVSTRTDVAAKLGGPDRIIEVNGRDVFQYYNYDLKSGLVLFFSRINVKSQDLYVFFNKDGIVEDVVFGKQKAPPEFQFWPFGD
jgi:outer membrane protein assembly factor BamE (lipoprotein component of BamABCDE complex)